MDEETTVPTPHKSIMVSKGVEISYANIEEKLDCLESILDATDEQAIEMLESVVPTYRHTPNC